MKKIERGYLLESTGREFYANGYIGAVESFEGSVDIAQGYDGYIRIDDDEDNEELTPIEKIEIADYMIELWGNLKRNLIPIM